MDSLQHIMDSLQYIMELAHLLPHGDQLRTCYLLPYSGKDKKEVGVYQDYHAFIQGRDWRRIFNKPDPNGEKHSERGAMFQDLDEAEEYVMAHFRV